MPKIYALSHTFMGATMTDQEIREFFDSTNITIAALMAFTGKSKKQIKQILMGV